MLRKSIFLFVYFILITMSTKAQYLETGITGGLSYYLGDLNHATQFSQAQPAGGIVVRYNYTTRWALKGNLLIGSLKGSDEATGKTPGRNLSFQSSISEFSLQAELNFLEYFTGSKRDVFTPYLFGGIALFMFNPKAEFQGNLIELQPLNTEGQNTLAYPDRKPYVLTNFSFPFGMGVKFSLNKKVCAGIEWGMRKTLSDYIDDLSTTYYLESSIIDPNNAEQFMSDPDMTHRPGMQRGTSKTTDWYSFAGVFITYKFSLAKEPTCNDFRNVQRFK
ncbi:MAG: DUF6089 family protein [Bacteroidales bacterium]|nr:DUF6089 family protein [Bacteroidales bacterium]